MISTPRAWATLLVGSTASIALAQQPDAHWSFDGSNTIERLAEAYGRTALDATEIGGSSFFNTRADFGETLANGLNLRYLGVAQDSALAPGSGDFSISVWTYRTSDTTTAAGILDALAGTGVGYQLFYQGDDTLRLRLDDSAGNFINCDTSSSHLSLNSWQNIIVTVDRTTDRVRFYVDGTEVAPIGGVDISGLTGSINPDQDLWISNLNNSWPANGRLDDLAFFKRLLIPTEIAAINANGGTPVLSIWPDATPPAVTFTPASGLVEAGNTITLSTDPSGPSIRYTNDGTEPDESSLLYTGPIPVTDRLTIKARAFVGGVGGPGSSASYLAPPTRRPNILMVVGDDIGFNDLGCYGAVSTLTPRLDALAGGGQRFTHFTTAGPGDLPSQHALLTGRLARRSGLGISIPSGFPGVNPGEWTLAEFLRKSGYQTGFVGTWHFGDTADSLPGVHGFQQSSTGPADWTTLTSEAQQFITDSGDDPFFLLFQPPAQSASGTSLLGSYGNQVEALDASVGALLDTLQSEGLTDDTLVIFFSDEGADRSGTQAPTGSNGQLRDGGGTTWEGGVRTPFITSWPGVIEPGDNYSTFWLPDLFRSIASLTGSYVALDRPIDSRDRSAAMMGLSDRPTGQETAYLHRHTGSGYELQALRSGEWKLHLSYNKIDPLNTTTAPAPLLYDLLADPIEHVDRSSSHTTELGALQALATQHEATFSTPYPQLPAPKPAIIGSIDTNVQPSPASPGIVRFDFVRPADSTPDEYLIEHGDDLVDWESIPSEPFVTASEIHEDGSESVTLEVPLDHEAFSTGRTFIRLVTNRPENP